MDASTPLVERKQNNRVSPLPQKKQAGNVREHLCYIAPPAQRILEKRARGVRTSTEKMAAAVVETMFEKNADVLKAAEICLPSC